MQKIEAIIRPFKLEEVKATLNAMGIPGATVSEVWVHSREKSNAAPFHSTAIGADYVSRIKLELVVPDEKRRDTTDAIRRVANTGKLGDGTILVSQVYDAIRIRTGEHSVATV